MKEKYICFDCDGTSITEYETLHTFPYGGQGVELSVKVPVQKCEDCGAEFLDYVAIDLMDDAVKRHKQETKGAKNHDVE